MAGASAAAFGSEAWGHVLGECHDLGKASRAFQEYLHSSSEAAAENASERDGKAGSVDHKTFGARYVAETVGKVAGQMLAYCIAGHHGGLPDAVSDDDAAQRSTLRYRLHERYPALHALPDVPPLYPLPDLKLTPLRIPWDATGSTNVPFSLAFYTRMLFSCLVDADRTCTEAFCDPERAAEREQVRPSLSSCKGNWKRF